MGESKKRMTDNELIKVLEWCNRFENNVVMSGVKGTKATLALEKMQIIKQVLKAYNQQKAEIERYKGVISILENDVKVASIEAVRGFCHFLIDRSKGGEIEVVDVTDLAVEYMNRLGGKGNEQ